MSTEPPVVLPFASATAELALIGGKGAGLAELAAAGLPVPDGFHVTTAAYRKATSHPTFLAEVDSALCTVDSSRPETLTTAESRIAAAFAELAMPEEVHRDITAAYHGLGADPSVAVRSSATAEDLPELSFAGQQETVLNVRGADAVIAAVRDCWASLWTARAIGYRARNGISTDQLAMAVVIQLFVPADAAGVLFTADPVTGDAERLIVNAGWGIGDSVVDGSVTPHSAVLDRTSGRIVEENIGAQQVRTVPAAQGTRIEELPPRLRGAAVLDQSTANELAELGAKIEAHYGTPMDIEWTLSDGRLSIVQARPITNLPEQRETWNDSLAGDYLWTSGNVGEAIPDVMTPCTWSLAKMLLADTMAATQLPGYNGFGNIGGRLYLNVSTTAAIAGVMGMSQAKFRSLTEDVFGKLPEETDIPRIPVSRLDIAKALIPVLWRVSRRIRQNARRMPRFLENAVAESARLRKRIGEVNDPKRLAEFWRRELLPYFRTCCQMMEAATRQGGNSPVHTRNQLRAMVDEADAAALFGGLASGGELASLGPVIGLSKLAKGEFDRETFRDEYGHRGPHEYEVSIPYPAEDSDWVDAQLAAFRESSIDVDALLAHQRTERDQAWQRFRAQYPRSVTKMRRQLGLWAKIAHGREATRSEVVRVFAVTRQFVLRAGELTGHGDDLFFLSIEEVIALLDGDQRALASIDIRKATYRYYSSLPRYPTVLRGRFDPGSWAADANRRADLYDEHGTARPASGAVTGFPGSAGVVEAIARVVASPAEGTALRQGEVLVTAATNIGWTPLFPRAAAVVTDVGAPLSHAAIVARELGIPAVVGCGSATMRLRTGDRVRVDGARGTVQRIDEPAER
ncbi:pyruvate,water dikinase [Tamaricihabitans halophyticus]|uniref:Pyruvate,water dikinase n=1 Tax=Tamaricihabitans halophyticus TaxID=1262583 RepID=A0A4R2RAH4_9PSEU|nr:PEP/pyruvate-binding domain-containing protein [Tamaricihabitans halophyticus]TCP56415.1 pyruvate,water dikinase [Tamaricihabitans halophyticus]